MELQMRRRRALVAGLTPEEDSALVQLHWEKLAAARRLKEIRKEEDRKGEIVPLENPEDRDMYVFFSGA